MRVTSVESFEQWRQVARDLRLADIPPHDIRWDAGGQRSLFDDEPSGSASPAATAGTVSGAPLAGALHVSRQFIDLAINVAYHRDPQRWHWLYDAFWRLTTGEPHLLEIATDETIYRLQSMAKGVRRDAHKMKAFVRFRQTNVDGGEHFVAWHRPDHRIVRKVAPFFSRRFKAMDWTILTPDESVTWDRRELHYGAGVPRSEAPQHDELEVLWKTYYANIFNPARIKVKMMKSEMPTRHWPTLPEAEIIDQLLEEAPARVQKMIAQSEGFATSAADFFPQPAAGHDLETLREAAVCCQGCDLYQAATQTVFGCGPRDARLVLVGEQPGDQEDLAGKPFIGPAGQLLDEALKRAGIERDEVYVTNVVKHFRFEPRGQRRLHKRPDARQVRACRPWFDAEWNALAAPLAERSLVCLGATAAQALMGPEFRIQRARGHWHASRYTPRTLATWHPSSILRLTDERLRRARFEELVQDLGKAKEQA